MHVALVGYIEHDAVAANPNTRCRATVASTMPIGADMTAVLVAICQQRGANLAAQFGELVGGKGLTSAGLAMRLSRWESSPWEGM